MADSVSLSRRGFIGSILAACAAPAIIKTAGLIMPVKPVLTAQVPGDVVNQWGGQFLTPEAITREALNILHQKTRFLTKIERDMSAAAPAVLRFRRPPAFVVRVV